MRWARCRSPQQNFCAPCGRRVRRLGSNRTVRVDIRVIATSNRPLEAAVAEGRFRADLYYRLNVIPISLPPLSDRVGDIRELADYFAGLYAAPGAGVHLSRELVARLEERAWPGNVRELANFVRRAVALSRGGEIGVEASRMGRVCPEKVCRLAYLVPGVEGGPFARRNGAPAFCHDSRIHRRQPGAGGRIAGCESAHGAQQSTRVWLAARTTIAAVFSIRIFRITTFAVTTLESLQQGATMSMIDTPLMRGLERVLDVSAFRHQVIATNLAKVDTPGYRTRDVGPCRRNRAGDGGRGGAIRGQFGGAAFTPVAHEIQGLLERPDGNNVWSSANAALPEQLPYDGGRVLKAEFHRLTRAINQEGAHHEPVWHAGTQWLGAGGRAATRGGGGSNMANVQTTRTRPEALSPPVGGFQSQRAPRFSLALGGLRPQTASAVRVAAVVPDQRPPVMRLSPRL